MSESSREKASGRASLKREVRKEIHSADAHLENLILEKQEGRKDAKAKEAKKEADSS